MPGENSVRAAVDIGGTFSDFQFHDAARSRVVSYKTPTTPNDPSEGLLTGLKEGAEKHGFALEDIGLIMHGSTIATNAVLERKLPAGALLTTSGFEDVLEIGRHIRKDVYALKAEERSVLIPRNLRFGIPERMRANGSIEKELDEEAVRALVPRLLEAGVETVAISFLHAYQNATHEARAAELIAEIAPQLSVATSSTSSPEIREYERTSTTVLNALLKPVISGYLERVQSRLEGAGITAPLYMVQSNGGVARPEEAARMPVKLLLSGPAGGAMAVAELAKRYQIDDLVGLDMGGTSSDVCVVHDGEVGETAESDIDGLPVRLPMIEIRTIGAGGGSLAGVETSALRVGPKSAGAVPGPACYGRGGTHPTVTDANVVLGRISPAAFMGGGMAIDVKSAQTAVNTHVSEPLALANEVAAAGIVDVANTHMAGAIRLSLFEKGADPADFTLVPFGGAAGLHACAVADELDINTIVFPADASTLSARGILGADLRRDLSLSDLMIAEPANIPRIATALEKLETDARALLNDDGLAADRQKLTFAGDLRYRGQAYEITTPWPELNGASDLDEAALDRLIAAFHTAHQTRFSHSASGEAVELVTLRVVAVGLLDQPDLSAATSTKAEDTAKIQHRRVVINGTWHDVPVHQRNDLQDQSDPIMGPAVIEETYTVILIDNGWQVTVAKAGDLRATRTGTSS